MLKLVEKAFLKLLGGTRNERIARSRMQYVNEHINPLEEQMRQLTDEQMRAKSDELRRRTREGEHRDKIKPEAFALVREAARRAINIRHFDVQLVAGMILDEGWTAEEATGEGKTFACYPAIYMVVLEGMHVHVVTVNDYLVQRDAEFARSVFAPLGITVGFITSDMPAYGPEARVRAEAYACDITYGTNSEFGFDYLRDNMKMSVTEQVQSSLDFAIIDEVDNILIDEARTPLIISGPAYGDPERYRTADAVAREIIARNHPWDRTNRRVESLKRQLTALRGEQDRAKGKAKEKLAGELEQAESQLVRAEDALDREVRYYEIELERKSAHLTHEGVGAAQEIAGIGSFYVGANMEWPHLMEQALRAHLVYEKDKDYVVQNGEVIIVDEFTGRLMEGRQWSDGLHQGVEAKEKVQVKQETQTIATITLQNYFKLYKKLAGMTGTAMTEANEFHKIYGLDVAAVETHRPVNRMDYNDVIYADTDAKYEAIVEEIHRVSMGGRPILVGTTSIEKSERLSEMLTHRYGIEHQVLNARPENAHREAEIVMNAGEQNPRGKERKMVGNVTIATNMAGRGTDIKLAPATVWKNCAVPSAEKLAELGIQPEELYPHGCNKCCIHCEQYDPATSCAHCFKPKLDSDFPLRGRTDCRDNVPCGLHIVGTERHEARRIDNQLRGRSGRQGDPGSSRFFLSLRDDLMTIFAGQWTLKVLGWLGLQGDMAIEDKRISKGIARAQKKVEEKNFEIRKNLLEYDEVMDHQRKIFYQQRQKILEGRELEGLVVDMLGDSVAEAVDDYLSGDYPRRCIAEWARQNLQITIEDARIRAENPGDLPGLEDDLRNRAKDEAASIISMTLGEYMGDDLEPGEWDLRGLSSWAMSRFNVNLSQNQLRKMNPREVETDLSKAANERIDEIDLSPLSRYLADGFTAAALADWAKSKFDIDVEASDLASSPEQVQELLTERIVSAYRRREIEYPVEYALDMTVAQAGTENVYAVGHLVEWANRKYDAELTVETLRGKKIETIRESLVGMSEQWLKGGRLESFIQGRIGSDGNVRSAIELARSRFDTELTSDDFDGDVHGKLLAVGQLFLRREMTELERYVLLQIYDGSWKDHLLGMDHLKSGIGLRSYAEQDPRVAYKREGARLFREMLAGVRDKVTDMIFKVRLTSEAQIASVYQISNMVHDQLSAYDEATREMDARQQRPGEMQKVKTIIREVPKVGRNDPCPCGSGRKYKKCCGKTN
ncbi:MAG: preprotein translocase subunit SecA [Planctomycetota bacterium]|jgi:preprotein translocase subunit SecA